MRDVDVVVPFDTNVTFISHKVYGRIIKIVRGEIPFMHSRILKYYYALYMGLD